MASDDGRTKTRIREEIGTERRQLDEAVIELKSSLVQTARNAGSALAALGTVVAVARALRSRRKR